MGSEREGEEHSANEQCIGNQPAGDKDNDLLITAIPFELPVQWLFESNMVIISTFPKVPGFVMTESALHLRSSDRNSTESVNDRLMLLQQLIPHGQEIDKEEILQVAIEYVRGLEKEIQMYNRSEQDGNKTEQGPLDTSPSSSDNALQKRGLCVVPLSALHKVF